MTRRKVARKVIPASVRAWVTDFKGKDLVSAYRKHYHTSRSCTIIELGMMGVEFRAEDVEEAKRRQIGSAASEKARKAKKTATKRQQVHLDERMVRLLEFLDNIGSSFTPGPDQVGLVDDYDSSPNEESAKTDF